jgi:hypothetical protein
MLADGHHRCHDGGDLRSPDAEMTNRLRTRRKNRTLAASSASVPSAVVIGTSTECGFILIACLPMALVLPIDSAAGGGSGDFGKSASCGQLSAR